MPSTSTNALASLRTFLTRSFFSRLLNMTTLRKLVLANKLEDKLVRAVTNEPGRTCFRKRSYLDLRGEGEVISALLTSPFLNHSNITLFEAQPRIYHAISQLSRLESLKIAFMSTAGPVDSLDIQAMSKLIILESPSVRFIGDHNFIRFIARNGEIESFGKLPMLKRLCLGQSFAKHHRFMKRSVE